MHSKIKSTGQLKDQSLRDEINDSFITMLFKYAFVYHRAMYLPQYTEVPHAAVTPYDELRVYCHVRCCRFGLNERCNVITYVADYRSHIFHYEKLTF